LLGTIICIIFTSQLKKIKVMKNGLELFNAMKAEAKALGINIKGMKKAEIEAAIVAAQEQFADQNFDDVEPQTEEVQIVTVAEVATAEIKRKGRPVDPNSPRQLRLAEQARMREEGLLRRGRPEVEGSARQQRMQARAAKLAAGLSIKPGRPKVVKPEVVTAE
jgi:hypothetical protein